MGLSIILTTLLTTFTSPDLCAEVYTDSTGQPYTDAIGQSWARFCEWTGPQAPRLELEVCCSFSANTANCGLPDAKGRCWSGASKRYCEYGEVLPTGGVTCYQPFPSACDFGFCTDVQPPGSGPLENLMCCWGGESHCASIESPNDSYHCAINGGYSVWCEDGVQHLDGTIECFD